MGNAMTGDHPELKMVNPGAAAIDIGSTMHMAAVNPDSTDMPVRAFGTFTKDLHALAAWFKSCGVTSVAMESTGVYWIPAFEILEQHGVHVILVNARYAKNVPGRKTDVSDAGWLRQLHAYGLLHGSFRPNAEIATLRAYMRQRERLVEYAAAHIQHMQKALMEMNLQLHHVVSDITGVTGMRIIRAIVAGERDPAMLSEMRDVRCRASAETIQAALTGNDRDEHIFALQQSLELYDAYQAKIAACDGKLETAVASLTVRSTTPTPLPKARARQKPTGAPAFDVRAALHGVLGVDLTQIHGLGPSLALKLVAECGTDLTAWPSAKHFTSWLCLAPGNKVSGGKLLSSRTRRSSSRAAALLRLAAVTIGRSDTALGAFYRRLSARLGKQKAVTATARKIAVLFFNTLRFGMRYHDPGAAAYDERHRTRVVANLQRRAKSLGYVMAPASDAAAVSQESRAHLRGGRPVTFRFVDEHRGVWPVRMICRVLGMSPSGYYAWRRRSESGRAAANRALLSDIRAVHAESGGAYGAPRVHAYLRAHGRRVGRHRVARLMRRAGLRGLAALPRRVRTTDSRHDHPIAPNRLRRNFTATAPNQVWLADLTYIRTGEGWLFLAALIDMFTRKVVGWAVRDTLHADITLEALAMAVERQRPAPGLIHHSDRGVQYAADDYRKALGAAGITPSMSRKGNCLDNAPMESFFHTLKVERVHHRVYATRADARRDLFAYIEGFYNSRRLHSGIGYHSPADMERMAA